MRPGCRHYAPPLLHPLVPCPEQGRGTGRDREGQGGTGRDREGQSERVHALMTLLLQVGMLVWYGFAYLFICVTYHDTEMHGTASDRKQHTRRSFGHLVSDSVTLEVEINDS